MNYYEPGQGTGMVLLTKISDPHGEVTGKTPFPHSNRLYYSAKRCRSGHGQTTSAQLQSPLPCEPKSTLREGLRGS